MEEIFVSHWKSLGELKTYLPMSSTLLCPNFSVHLRSYTKCQCYPESWARYIHTQFEENQVSTSSTTQQNVFTVQQIQPQAIFAGAHIDKFEGCTFNINVFCGDQSKIARLNENWFAERSRHKQALLTLQLHFWSLFINCCFNHKLFHWACMKNFVFIHWQSLCKSGTLNSYVSVKWKLQHLPPTPSPPASIPQAFDTFGVPGGENLIIRVLQGVGIWTAPSISCEISGVVSCRGGRGVRGFSWKRLCLWGQLVTSFVPYLKVFEF